MATRIAPRPLLPPEGVLARLAVSADGWPRSLPAVPTGYDVTVSFSSPAGAAHAPALAERGYRSVGVAVADGDGRATADFLVPLQLVQDEPVWWAQLAAVAERVFDLALGPVQRLLDAQLRTHRRASV